MASYDITLGFLPPTQNFSHVCNMFVRTQFSRNILQEKMIAFTKMKLLLFITILLRYAASEDFNDRSINQYSNKLKFEDDLTPNDEEFPFEDNEARQYGLIYEDPNNPLRFPKENQPVNQINTEEHKKKRRRRRRRKPKNQALPNSGYPGYPRPGEAYSGLEADPYLNPGYQVPNGVRKPRRRPKPSIASEAFSSILSALTSTALYDDKQCVPRMLCEAAGGGSLGSSSLLQSITGLQPLLTLLSAYNGITSSPLFVFGRAVFLGMTSKGNTGTCRYAYPYCPTDPEQLVHYLNNHNGGFFRFFNSPQLDRPHEQNVEQFYNQLSGGYGLYQPSGPNQDYGSNQGYGFQQPNLYAGQNGYGLSYDYEKLRPYTNAEERIQNKPSNKPDEHNYVNDDDTTKWRFPDDYEFDNDNNLYPDNTQTIRGSRTLKFPDQNSENTRYHQYNDYIENDYIRREKNVKFEDNNRHNYRYPQSRPDYDNVYDPYKYPKDTRVNNDDYEFDQVHNFYVKKNRKEEDVRIVYVVRGDGDPNHPEIIKIRPGESISK